MKRFDWAQWKEPDMRYRPMARWWWPGLDVDEDVLLSQLDDLKKGGFAGAEIQAFCTARFIWMSITANRCCALTAMERKTISESFAG